MITYPLNNIEYSAEDAELYNATRTSGIYYEDDFDITVSGNDTVATLSPGMGWIANTRFSGKVFAEKQESAISFDISDAIYDRIDAVVVQYSAEENGTKIIIKKGEPSSVPMPPDVIRTPTIYELHLYHVYRSAGSSVVTQTDISDLRDNNQYCGYMTSDVAIDEAVVRYDEPQELTESEKAMARQNIYAAPAGYGLGEIWPPQIESLEALDTLTTNGWSKLRVPDGQGSLTVAGVDVSYCSVYNERYSPGQGLQRLTPPYGLQVQRTMSGNTWATWENINPPMALGVEYRTTERYEGKPVYTKLVDCGNITNNKEVTAFPAGCCHIRWAGRYGVGTSWQTAMPAIGRNADGVTNVYASAFPTGTNILLYCNDSYAGKLVYVQSWYIKS